MQFPNLRASDQSHLHRLNNSRIDVRKRPKIRQISKEVHETELLVRQDIVDMPGIIMTIESVTDIA